MADQEHVERLRAGVQEWNQWRQSAPETRPDLTKADLSELGLRGVDFHGALLTEANLSGSDLSEAELQRAVLIQANLEHAKLQAAQATEAIGAGVIARDATFSGAVLWDATFPSADFTGADLEGAHLMSAVLHKANFTRARMHQVNLQSAQLGYAIFDEADLREVDLRFASLVRASARNANLDGALVYGTAVWGVDLEGASQRNLVIQRDQEYPTITLDNIEIAQFLYLMTDNQKLRDVIDTITTKVILILGRFTQDRKAVLDALRIALRPRNYVPVIFDFEPPESKSLTETVTLLARMARFIIADLTDPASVPQELTAIVQPWVITPIVPIIQSPNQPYALFKDLKHHPSMLPLYSYPNMDTLIAQLDTEIIEPAENYAQRSRQTE